MYSKCKLLIFNFEYLNDNNIHLLYIVKSIAHSKMFKCSYCSYFTTRKFNYDRHVNAKHDDKTLQIDNCSQNEENVEVLEENVEVLEENVELKNLKCSKCYKKYKTKKFLINHESNCKGIDELTCSKCMKSFPSRSSKSHHIRRNTCNARSIIYAREPNATNIIQTQNIQNIQTQNNIQTNNIIINNFGQERLDHISHEDIRKILLSGANTLPKYIEKKHFDKDFPENKNILYTRENRCKVLEDDGWKEKDISLLSSKLIKDNARVLLLYCDENEIKLSHEINDDDIYQHVKNKLVIIYNKSDNAKYNFVLNSIKELLKNAKDE